MKRDISSIKGALFVSLIYVVASSLWILLSDYAVSRQPFIDLIRSPQTIKGLGFITASAVILFFLIQFQLVRRARIEQALRESEKNFRLFMENLPGAVFIKDPDGRTRYCNTLYASTTGRSSEELTGKLTSDYLPEATAQAFETENRQVLAEGRKIEFYHDFPGLDGPSHWLTIKFPIPHEGGMTLLGAMSLDITERRKSEIALAESEKRFRSLFETIPQGVVYQDSAGHITTANPAAEQILGIGHEELIERVSESPEWQSIREDGTPFAASDHPAMVALAEGQEIHDVVMGLYNPRCKGYRWIKIDAIPQFRPGEEKPFQVYTTFTDITERRLAEQNLTNSEALLRSVLDTNPNTIFVKDSEARFQLVNHAFANLYHLAPEDLLGKTTIDLANEGILSVETARYLHEHDLSLLTERRDDFIAEEAFSLPNEKVHWFQARNIFLQLPGQAPMMLGVGTDITDRKNAESAFIESQRVLETLMSNLPGMAYRCGNDPDWTMSFVSEGCLALTGYPSTDLLENQRLAFADLIHPDDRPSIWDLVQNAVMEHRSFELLYRINAGDGQEKWVWEKGRGVYDEEGQLLSLEGFVTDITERKKSEGLLEERARQLELLNQIAEEINAVLDQDTLLKKAVELIQQSFNYERVSLFILDPAARMLVLMEQVGLQKDQLLKDFSLSLDQGIIGWSASHKERLLVPDVHQDSRYVMGQPDVVITSEMALPIMIDEQVFGVIDIQSKEVNAFDINDVVVMETLADTLAVAVKNARLYAELEHYNEVLEHSVSVRTAELTRTKRRIETILNSSPDGILLINEHGVIDTSNPALMTLFDKDHNEDCRGNSLYILVHESSLKEVKEALERVVKDRKVVRLEFTAQTQLGRLFDAEMALAPMGSHDHETNTVCMIRDISTLKEAERVREDFASNVSHELRTPITGLRLNYHLLSVDHERREIYTARIGREIERLTKIIEDLLRLSRMDQEKGRIAFSQTDLNSIASIYVSDREPLAAQKDLSLRLETAPDLPTVMADEGLIGQVVSIFLTNAISYTPAGGMITLTTKEAGDEVGLSVCDTGPGIQPEEQKELFKRFFRGRTGRDSGTPGTGLGLAIANEIVTRHNGRIEVISEGVAGKGTEFTFWLPRGVDNAEG